METADPKEMIRRTEKRYCAVTMAAAILMALVFIVLEQKPVGKGLVLGALFSVINFVLMGETLPARLGKSRKKTFTFSIGSILVRYLILAVPVVVALKFSQFNLVSAVIGIFGVQIVILADHLYGLIFPKYNEMNEL